MTTIRVPIPHADDRGRPITFTRNPKTGNLTPSITENKRVHPMKRSSLQKRIRTAVARLVSARKVPPQQHIAAWLELHHPEKGKKYLRDAGNLSPMAKAAYDALQPPKQPYWSPKRGKFVGGGEGASVIPDDEEQYLYRAPHRIVRGSVDYPQPMIVLVIQLDA